VLVNQSPYPISELPLPYPAAPSLTSPANNAILQTIDASLSWTQVATAFAYRVQIAVDPAFNQVIRDRAQVTANALTVSGLAGNTVYHWRVRAANTRGEGPWTAAWKFTIPAAGFTTPVKNISVTAGGSSRYPKVVSLPGTEYIFIIWVESSGGNDALYFSRTTDGGATWTVPLALSGMSGQILGRESDLEDNYAISIDVDEARVHVVMQKRSDGADDFEIYYRRSQDLGLSWGNWVQLTNNSADTRHTDVAARSGYVHVTYQDSWPGNNEIMYKRILNYGGGAVDQTRRLTTNPWNSCFPRIAVAKSGDMVNIVYQDDQTGQDNLYLKHVDGSGAGACSTSQLTAGGYWNGLPDIAASTGADDQFVYIVYQALWPGNREVMYKRLGNYGHAGGGVVTGRLTYSAAESRSPAIVFDGGSNNIYVVYHDNWPGNYDVMYRKLSNYGGAGFSGQRVSWGTGDSSFSAPTSSGAWAFIVWMDNSSGNYEIYVKYGT
jgi:hypothetical protein